MHSQQTQEEEVPSFLTAEAMRCTEVTCAPLQHTVRGRAQLSPVQTLWLLYTVVLSSIAQTDISS